MFCSKRKSYKPHDLWKIVVHFHGMLHEKLLKMIISLWSGAALNIWLQSLELAKLHLRFLGN